MKDIRTVNEDTTKKLELLDSQLKECTKFLNAIDNYMSDTHVKIDTVRGMVCNTCISMITIISFNPIQIVSIIKNPFYRNIALTELL